MKCVCGVCVCVCVRACMRVCVCVLMYPSAHLLTWCHPLCRESGVSEQGAGDSPRGEKRSGRKA